MAIRIAPVDPVVTYDPTVHQMLRRLTNKSWKQFLRFFTFGSVKDEWTFDVGGTPCLVLNDWRAGMRLLAANTVVAENRKVFSLDTQRPFLSATIADGVGRSRRVDVFVKVLLWVDIRVRIDGHFLSTDYV